MMSSSSFQRAVCSAGFAAALALMTGCASPGPPRAPSLRLPVPVTLSAERHGNTVVVRFETPERTTDGQFLTRDVSASLCRSVGDGPCVAASSFPGKIAIAGAVEWVDVLPPELVTGVARRMTYRVTAFNVNGRTAGPSEAAVVVAGEAPRNVEALRAEGSGGGIVLRWTPEAQASGEVLVKREALDSTLLPKRQVGPESKMLIAPKAPVKHKGRAPQSKKPAKPAEDENTVWLHAAAASERDSGGMIDATAVVDEPYRYTAVRSREVMLDGKKVEMRSELSDSVTVTLRDVFPPAVPQGLLVASFPVEGATSLGVDLVWQPDSESDLAGYNVYRQVAAADGSVASKVKLNEKVVPLPAFHDATAMRGVAYRYVVTAVDAKGNESAASDAAELAATP